MIDIIFHGYVVLILNVSCYNKPLHMIIFKKFFSFKVRYKLIIYQKILLDYNSSLSLVGTLEKDKIWYRHFVDSAQLLKYIPPCVSNVIDIGSGAGFPGVILSLLGISNVVLVEKSYKKSLFLRKICLDLKISARVFSGDIRDLDKYGFDLITSRAFSNIYKTIGISYPFFSSKSLGIFLKGSSFKKELDLVKKEFFLLNILTSSSNVQSRVLRISHLLK